MKEEKEKKKGDGPGKNGVIITVYIESNTRGQRKNFNLGRANNKQKLCSSKHSNSTINGYDRKAELLAYARDLRYDSHEAKWPRKNLKTKIKSLEYQWSWKPSRLKFRVSFMRMLRSARRRWKFGQITSEKEKKVEERSSLLGEINGDRKSRTQRKNSHHFCRRLRCALKEISCGWKCNKE